MILASHGIIGSSIVQFAFDADYQAVLDYATTQGYTLPSAGQQILQNQLVVDLKDGGIWSKLDTFAVFATDGDSDFALIDWIRLSDYTAVNSPTFTANQGFAGNGATSYINTSFNPTMAVKMTSNNANFTVRMNTVNDVGLKFFYGCLDAFAVQLGEDNAPANMRPDIFGNNSNVPSVAKIGANWFSTNRNNSLTNVLIQNTSSTSSNNTFRGMPNVNLALLGRISNLGVLALPTTRQISMFAAGENLISENTDFYNSFNTYFTSL
jgi:hypothetical protein